MRRLLQPPHDELQEKERGLTCAFVGREIPANARFLLTTEWRIGEDYVNTILRTQLGDFHSEAVAVVNRRSVQAVQQQVHLSQHVR